MQFKQGEYVVYRIHMTGLGNEDVGIATSLANLPGTISYTAIIPATFDEEADATNHDGEFRSRFPTLWQGDRPEELWQEALKKRLLEHGMVPAIEVERWESCHTLEWADRPNTAWASTLA